ncbi:MAG: hypothetical protein RLZ33_1908, partial [Bacteroidota bacterium]
LEDKIEELLSTAASILRYDGFLLMNTYSPTIDARRINQLAGRYFPKRNISVKELWMKTTTGKELYYGILLKVN